MPFILEPGQPEPDKRLESLRQVAELALRINERLLAENAALRRRLAAPRPKRKSA